MTGQQMTPSDRAPLFEGEGIVALAAIPEDAPALQKLLEASADYYELTMGLPPGPAEAQNLFMQLPQGKTYEDKSVISVLTDSGKFIGVLDLIRNHPEPGTWWLGLMLLHPDSREKGIGARLFHALRLWLKERGAKQLSLSVLQPNEAAYRFWKRMGMELKEIRPPSKFGAKVSRILVMTRRLAAD